MTQRAPILGIAGLVFLLFGLLSHWLAYDPGRGIFAFGWYSLLHLVAGVVCLAWYFATGASSLTDFVRQRSTRYGLGALVYSGLFVAVVGMVNFLGTRYHARFDLSEEGVNSLSPQSHEVLDRLDEQVSIEAFIEGGRDPVLEELFEAYDYHGDRISHRFIDPQIRPELAQEAGITQVPTLRISKGERSTLVTATDEESVTNGIHRVSTTATKRIYFTEGHGEPDITDKESAAGYGRFADALRNQNYQVESVFLADVQEVPEDADVLIVASPSRELFPHEIEVIERFISAGASAMFLLEPRRGEAIVELVSRWGITVGRDVIVDQQLRLFEGVSLGLEPVVSSYGKHAVVAPITERTVFSLARSVSPAEPGREGLSVEPLAFTPATSWAETDVDRLFDAGEARMTEEDTEGPVSIAVAASANLADLDLEQDDSASARGERVQIVVFGDSTFASNKFWLQLFNDALVLSAVGWLAGQEELISIGPRAIRSSRARLSPAQALTVFYLSVLVIPELILLCGIIVWWRRSVA